MQLYQVPVRVVAEHLHRSVAPRAGAQDYLDATAVERLLRLVYVLHCEGEVARFRPVALALRVGGWVAGLLRRVRFVHQVDLRTPLAEPDRRMGEGGRRLQLLHTEHSDIEAPGGIYVP